MEFHYRDFSFTFANAVNRFYFPLISLWQRDYIENWALIDMITLIQRRYICKKRKFSTIGNGKLPPSSFWRYLLLFRSTFFVQFVPFVIVSGVSKNRDRNRIAAIRRRGVRSEKSFDKGSAISRRGFHSTFVVLETFTEFTESESIGLTLCEHFMLPANYAMMIDSTRWRNSWRNGLAIMVFVCFL